MTKKWIKVKSLPIGQYTLNKNLRFFCDYSDPYIVVKGAIIVEGDKYDKTRNKKLIFKNSAPFRSCISTINNTFIDNAENLDIVMPMCNLLEYSDNYSITSGSLWNFYRDEINILLLKIMIMVIK